MDLASAPLTEITELCRSLGWIGPNTVLDHGEPAGAGNMNRTLRVHLANRDAGEPQCLVLKQSLPFVARFPEIPAPIERSRIEAAFYQSIASDPALRQRAPVLRGFHVEDHLLCLEDLGRGSDMTGLYAQNAFNDDTQMQLRALTTWLSELHARPAPPHFPDNAAMRELNHEHIFCVPFNTQSGVSIASELVQLRRDLAANPEFMDVVETLGHTYLGNESFQSRPVLLHGDYYPGSWLNGEQGNAAVIDPEFGFVGPAEFDVGVMQAHLTFADYPADSIAELMQSYQRQAGFDTQLMQQFSAVEILRRLLGVAQLPLSAAPAQQLAWAWDASTILSSSSS